jgi:hypothetical protein
MDHHERLRRQRDARRWWPARWPDPQPDPPAEPGEDFVTHLLPTLERLRAMTPRERFELLDLVDDWHGPLVERFRTWVIGL